MLLTRHRLVAKSEGLATSMAIQHVASVVTPCFGRMMVSLMVQESIQFSMVKVKRGTRLYTVHGGRRSNKTTD